MSDGIKLIGLEELFNRVDNATAFKTLNVPLRKGAYHLQGWIQKNRLSGPRPDILGVVTDRLRSSIYVQNKKKLEFTIGTNVEYAPIHEFGLTIKRRSPKGNQFSATYPKRPFMQPAFSQENIDLITKAINENIKLALSKTTKESSE